MLVDKIRKVTIPCPLCDTAVKFNIPKDTDGYTDMTHKMANFQCPLCHTSLSENASNVLNAIRAYNNAASALETAASFTNTGLDFE